MEILKQFGIGAIVGSLLILLFFWFPFSTISLRINAIIIILFIFVFTLWIFAWVVTKQINKLIKKDVQGDAEDEAEGIINRKLYDYSFCMNVSAILAILGLAMAMIDGTVVLIVIGVVATIISTMLSSQMMKLMKKAYPERNLPDAGEKDFSKKLFDASDDGERFIMMQGLYKTFNFTNAAFLFAIVGITLYSVATEDSQLFSIVIIASILLISNVLYILTIRNK